MSKLSGIDRPTAPESTVTGAVHANRGRIFQQLCCYPAGGLGSAV
jgi:hypothetical protein